MCLLLTKRIKKYIFTLIFLIVQCTYSYAITIEEAVDIGIQNNAFIIAEQEKLNISDAEVKQASMMINPRVVLEATTADRSYNGFIEQVFEMGGKRKQRVKIAKLDKEITIQKINQEIIDFRSSVSEAYITHYCNILRLKKAEEWYSDAKNLLAYSKKQKENKNADMSEAEIYVLNCYNDLTLAQVNFNKSYNDLNFMLGGNLDKKEELVKPDVESRFENVKEFRDINNVHSLEQFYNIAIQNSPEIKSIEKTIEKAEKQKKLARLTAVPNTLISAGPNISAPQEKIVGVFAAVGLEIPVFNHGQADLKYAKAIKAYNEKQLLAKKNRLNLEIKNIYASIIHNEKTMKTYQEELIPRALSLYQTNKQKFQKGKCNVLVPMLAQETVTDIQTEYINTFENYQKALNNFERVIGLYIENL